MNVPVLLQKVSFAKFVSNLINWLDVHEREMAFVMTVLFSTT